MKVTQLAKEMQRVLNEEAEVAGDQTGFVQRESKMTAALYVQTLVMGWLADPNSSIEALVRMAGNLGLQISAQGLDKRFNESAAECLKEVLLCAVAAVVGTSNVPIELLQRFSGVKLFDSTTIALPPALVKLWPGCGGTNGSSAALKLDVCLDLLTGQLSGPGLLTGRSHEATAELAQADLPVNSLSLADLAYFNLDRMERITNSYSHWLSRYKTGVAVYNKLGQRMNLIKTLKKRCHIQLDIKVLLGQAKRLPARLIAQRLPADIVKQRRKELKAEAKREGQEVSAEKLALAEWNIYLTNLSQQKLSLKEVLVLMRSRWQIELLFKLWKSHGLVDESRSIKTNRILCEVYAKLIGMVIQHWLILISCWHIPQRSLVKASQTIRLATFHLTAALTSLRKLAAAITDLMRSLSVGVSINKRKSKPNTYQLLLNPDILG
jgi:hypothetical protein